jgi:ubiquinone biosynthesis protein
VVLPDEAIGLMDFGMVGHLAPSDKADLANLYMVAMQQDVPGAADQLMRMGVARGKVDRVALERDLRRMMHKYYGLSIGEFQVGEMIEEFMTVAFRHRLHFPSNLWLVAKTLGMVEGLGVKLAPDFDMFTAAQDYVRRYRRRMWLPSYWAPSMMRGVSDLTDLMLRLPQQTTRLLEQAERGGLEAQVRMPDFQHATDHLDRIANRLAQHNGRLYHRHRHGHPQPKSDLALTWLTVRAGRLIGVSIWHVVDVEHLALAPVSVEYAVTNPIYLDYNATPHRERSPRR